MQYVRSMTRALVAELILLLALPASAALQMDTDQPLEIEADAARLDEVEQVTVYTGDVVVTQGSLRMWGDRLTVRYDDEQRIDTATLTGRPARFVQSAREGQPETRGHASRIDYHAQVGRIELIDDAEITQQGRLFSGPKLAYDLNRRVWVAKGAPAPPGAATGRGTGGRVRVVIPPRRPADRQP